MAKKPKQQSLLHKYAQSFPPRYTKRGVKKTTPQIKYYDGRNSIIAAMAVALFVFGIVSIYNTKIIGQLSKDRSALLEQAISHQQKVAALSTENSDLSYKLLVERTRNVAPVEVEKIVEVSKVVEKIVKVENTSKVRELRKIISDLNRELDSRERPHERFCR